MNAEHPELVVTRAFIENDQGQVLIGITTYYYLL
jgi:hypothetical protein